MLTDQEKQQIAQQILLQGMPEAGKLSSGEEKMRFMQFIFRFIASLENTRDHSPKVCLARYQSERDNLFPTLKQKSSIPVASSSNQADVPASPKPKPTPPAPTVTQETQSRSVIVAPQPRATPTKNSEYLLMLSAAYYTYQLSRVILPNMLSPAITPLMLIAAYKAHRVFDPKHASPMIRLLQQQPQWQRGVQISTALMLNSMLHFALSLAEIEPAWHTNLCLLMLCQYHSAQAEKLLNGAFHAASSVIDVTRPHAHRVLSMFSYRGTLKLALGHYQAGELRKALQELKKIPTRHACYADALTLKVKCFESAITYEKKQPEPNPAAINSFHFQLALELSNAVQNPQAAVREAASTILNQSPKKTYELATVLKIKARSMSNEVEQYHLYEKATCLFEHIQYDAQVLFPNKLPNKYYFLAQYNLGTRMFNLSLDNPQTQKRFLERAKEHFEKTTGNFTYQPDPKKPALVFPAVAKERLATVKAELEKTQPMLSNI